MRCFGAINESWRHPFVSSVLVGFGFGFKFICVYKCFCLCVCMCTVRMNGSHEVWKRASDALEMELVMAVRHHKDTGN